MNPNNEQVADLAQHLFRPRPSQRKEIALRLTSKVEAAIFEKAVEVILARMTGDNEEALEQAYFFGSDVYRIFLDRKNQKLHFNPAFHGLPNVSVLAFLAGYQGVPFEDALRKAFPADEMKHFTGAMKEAG